MQTTTAKKSILESPPWNSDYRRLCGLFPLGLKLQYWKSSFPLWMCGVGLGSTVAKDAWNKTLTFASIHCDNFYSAPFEVVPCTNDVVTKKIEKVPQSICKIVLSLLMISFWCKCTNSKQVLIFFRHSKVFQYRYRSFCSFYREVLFTSYHLINRYSA